MNCLVEEGDALQEDAKHIKMIGSSLVQNNYIEKMELQQIGTNESCSAQVLNSTDEIFLPPPAVPFADIVSTRIFFLVAGAANALNFSAMLQSFKTISENLYEFKLGTDTVVILYHLLSFLTAAGIIYYRAVGVLHYYIGLLLLLLASIMFPLCVEFFSGTAGIVLVHLICCVMGFGMSLVTSNVFSFSTVLPTNFTGFVVAGNSLSGIISMVVWILVTNTLFNIEDKDDVKLATWSLYSVVVAFLTVQAGLFYRISRRKWFVISTKGFFMIMRDPLLGREKEGRETFLPPHLRCRPIFVLARKALEPLILSTVAMCIGYALFPNIGPNQFVKTRDDPALASILTGLYQAFDFVGRYMPNLGPMFVLTPVALRLLVYGRLSFIAIYFLFFYYEDISFFTNFYVQGVVIMISAVLHGFTSSQTLIDVPKILKTSTERGAIGLFSNLSMQLGVLLGLTFAIVLKFATDPNYLLM